jgi:hypothetical protein
MKPGLLKRITPYLVLELFVPGGTVLAILLFLHRRKQEAAHLPGNDSLDEAPPRDHGAAGAFAAMASCSVILLLMLAA